MNPLEVEIAISALHSTGEFQVLRKLILDRDMRFTQRLVPGAKTAICIDKGPRNRVFHGHGMKRLNFPERGSSNGP